VIGRIRFSAASVALLLIQLALVCSVGAKYLYQRWTCPRVWTRAAAYGSEYAMEGRYLVVQLTVDGCQSTLPSARQAEFPRDVNGAAVRGDYWVRAGGEIDFRAELRVVNNKLTAIHYRDGEKSQYGQWVRAGPASLCDQMRLAFPTRFYMGGRSPLPLAAGSELWMEVTVPPNGPPRPVQLALKRDGAWHPLAFQ